MQKRRYVAIIAGYEHHYDRQVVEGISRFVQEHEHWKPYIPLRRHDLVSRLKKWRGDGIIAALDDPKVFELVSEAGIPAVGFGDGKGSRGRPIPYFASDDAAIAKLGAHHFLDRGFTNFAFCALPDDTHFQPWSNNRCNAYVEMLERSGYECSVFRSSVKGERDWEFGYAELCDWLRSLEKPVGLMASYDGHALYVLEACQDIDLAVPEEVAVIGVDNEELICDLADPPLTSIVQGAVTLGYQAATVLDNLMKGETPTDRTTKIAPTGIVTRQSSDVMAIEDRELVSAIRFVREKAATGIGVGDVAKHLSLSRHSLDRRFRRVLGRTVHAEIQRVQIERVKHLLRSTSLPAKDIAERSGFRYREYLSNVFRQVTGQTLGEYRRDVATSQDVAAPVDNNSQR